MKFDKLGNYVALNQGLAINSGSSHLVSNICNDEFSLPLLRIADMIENSFSKYISIKVNPNVIANEDDIIYTRTGKIGLAFKGFCGVVHNNSFIVHLNSNLITKNYLYTCLQTNFVRYQALKMAKSSVQPDLTHDMFKSIVIPIPDSMEEQENISKYYNNLSNKIENNNRIISELESLAKTIYDYWFLQFEFPNEEGKPYKSSGGKMIRNEELKREIPEGWEAKNVSDFADITWGQCPNGENILDRNTEEVSIDYCSGAGDMHGGFLVDCQAKTNDGKRSAKDNDILVSVAGAIGNMCVVDHDISLGRAAMAYTVKDNSYLMFLYQSLKMLNKKILTISSGSIQKVINSNNIKEFNIPYNAEIIKKYSETANLIFFQLKELTKQNQQLTKQITIFYVRNQKADEMKLPYLVPYGTEIKLYKSK